MKTMFDIPKDPRAIRARIRSYERKLRQEREDMGVYGDGAGKRYLLGPLYMAMGDDDGALESFAWFEREFGEDESDPMQCLCWALLLHRFGREHEAIAKLRRTMLENRYIFRRLLGEDITDAGDYSDDGWDCEHYRAINVPAAFLDMWNEDELAWCRELHGGTEFTRIRQRFFDLERALEGEPPGAGRDELLAEQRALRG